MRIPEYKIEERPDCFVVLEKIDERLWSPIKCVFNLEDAIEAKANLEARDRGILE